MFKRLIRKALAIFTIVVLQSSTFVFVAGANESAGNNNQVGQNLNQKNTIPLRPFKEDRVIVKYKSSAVKLPFSVRAQNSLQTQNQFDDFSVEIFEITNGQRVEDVINTLSKDFSVEYVQPDYIYYPRTVTVPNDTHFG
ncbi:MAG: S8 family serine peptidase [Thermincolia bacterium]